MNIRNIFMCVFMIFVVITASGCSGTFYALNEHRLNAGVQRPANVHYDGLTWRTIHRPIEDMAEMYDRSNRY